jgi:glucose/arabinose dehydrogenase
MTRFAGALAGTVLGVLLAGGAGLALAAGTRTGALSITQVARGFQQPVLVTGTKSEPNRLYVVEQPGLIRVLVGGRLRAEPFLDVRSRIVAGGEQGLLGLAFDPAYAKNHRFYVNYTSKGDGATHVVAFRSDGTRAILSSAQELLRVGQPYANHNGGNLAFGPDGKLYVGMGDGGSGGDPQNRAQNPNELLGKLLRLDPTGRTPAEIVAVGLRNPWRFSFDRATGDLYIGDVGQNAIEEVDYVRAGTNDLLNFGWPLFEGTATYKQAVQGPGRLVGPIAQYSHENGCTVVGGFVYRGRAVPAAVGRYFYGDYCSGTIWSLRVSGGKASRVRREPFRVGTLSSFGERPDGELYLVSLNGTIYRLRSR